MHVHVHRHYSKCGHPLCAALAEPSIPLQSFWVGVGCQGLRQTGRLGRAGGCEAVPWSSLSQSRDPIRPEKHSREEAEFRHQRSQHFSLSVFSKSSLQCVWVKGWGRIKTFGAAWSDGTKCNPQSCCLLSTIKSCHEGGINNCLRWCYSRHVSGHNGNFDI